MTLLFGNLKAFRYLYVANEQRHSGRDVVVGLMLRF